MFFASLVLWASLNAIDTIGCHTIHDRQIIHFNEFPLASSPESTWASPRIPETFVATIPFGSVYSADGHIFSGQYLLEDFIWRWSYLKKNKKELCVTAPLIPIKATVAVIGQEGSHNYYHWLLEVLPRIALLEGISFDFICTAYSLPFQKQTLDYLGIDQEKVIPLHKDTYLQAEKLIVPSFASLSCYTPSWIVQFLRDSFLPYAEKQHDADYIFISRKKASYRRISNEDQLFDSLKPFGFKLVYLEDLPFIQQVGLFNSAKVIVAPHGAGLANLVFCNPEAVVIEIFQEHEDDTFWYLSQTVGLKKHVCIKTVPFCKNGGYNDTALSQDSIDEISAVCSAYCLEKD